MNRLFAADRYGTGDVVVVRPRRAMIAAWVGAAAIMAVTGTVAVLLRNSPTGVFFRTVDQVAIVLIGAFISGGLLLFARPRVRADAAGIEVRNVGGRRVLPWTDVVRVAFPDGAPWARLDLADDEYIPVLAIQATDGARAVDGIRKVRALHAAGRGAPG